jgi:hypothetical protein
LLSPHPLSEYFIGRAGELGGDEVPKKNHGRRAAAHPHCAWRKLGTAAAVPRIYCRMGRAPSGAPHTLTKIPPRSLLLLGFL